MQPECRFIWKHHYLAFQHVISEISATSWSMDLCLVCTRMHYFCAHHSGYHNTEWADVTLFRLTSLTTVGQTLPESKGNPVLCSGTITLDERQHRTYIPCQAVKQKYGEYYSQCYNTELRPIISNGFSGAFSVAFQTLCYAPFNLCICFIIIRLWLSPYRNRWRDKRPQFNTRKSIHTEKSCHALNLRK
jgi:hypothetical protein